MKVTLLILSLNILWMEVVHIIPIHLEKTVMILVLVVVHQMATFTQSTADGQTIIWRVSGSPVTSNTGSTQKSTTVSDANSCAQPPSFSISQALGSCSATGGNRTSTLTITNNASALLF